MDAGLIMHGRVKLGEKEPTVLLRNEDKILPSKGHTSLRVITPDRDEIIISKALAPLPEFEM